MQKGNEEVGHWHADILYLPNYTVICYYEYTNGMRNRVNQQLASVDGYLTLCR